jgi:hypothetical protein
MESAGMGRGRAWLRVWRHFDHRHCKRLIRQLDQELDRPGLDEEPPGHFQAALVQLSSVCHAGRLLLRATWEMASIDGCKLRRNPNGGDSVIAHESDAEPGCTCEHLPLLLSHAAITLALAVYVL